ncbi:hypothetical protein KY289_031643 [Solanum tuberosum]|nr:hypothetical protein KY289_031643 [Solanum tuberosum]
MANVDNELPEKLSHNHPLFLHTIDNSGVLLSSIQLTGADNYSVWSRTMKIAILGRNKLGFIDGSCRKEAYGPNLTNLWEMCNAIVLSWIMNCVSKELLGGIVYSTNATSVWKNLQERYDKVDGSRIFQLHKEIATITQVPRSRPSHTSTYDPNAFCDYCKRTGHTQAVCYQLHGYPPGYERKKKGQFSTNTGRGRPPNERRQYPAANNVVSESEHNHRSDLDHNRCMSSGNHGGSHRYGRGNSQVDQTDYQRGMTVLHEQYNQIITMLGQTNVHGGTEGPFTSHSSQSSANLAYEYPTIGTSTALTNHSTHADWIIDS